MALIQTSPLALPTKAQSGGNTNGVPSGFYNELVVSEFAPRYSNLAKLGKVFVARAALQTLSASGTAMTGLIVWNSSSVNNGVDMHLMKATGDVAVTSASLTGIALATSAQVAVPGTTTAASSQTSTYIGTGNGAGIAYNVATVTTAPTARMDVMHNTAAIGTTGEDQGFLIDFEGSIIIPPQTLVCFVALGAASAASAVNLNLMWAELPA